MKGNRAKKEAEAAAAAAGGQLEPTPPSGAPDKAPRPGPLVTSQNGDNVQMSAAEFKSIIGQIRTNELLGAAAADCLEAAAGLRAVASPQSKGAKELREKTAGSRDDEAPKKKGGNFSVEDIPDVEEKPSGKRASLSNEDDAAHDIEEKADLCSKDAAEPPELNLTPKQNKNRVDLEMWVMDEIPAVFGVDDAEELGEALEEDAQADKITFLIAEQTPEKQAELAEDWLKDAPDKDKKDEFVKELLEKVRAIQDMGPKKKKKKKKADA